MEDDARYRWIAAHIFPCESEIRRWLRRHVHTLRSADVDDVLQEAYAKIWESDFANIVNARGYFYTVVRNLLLEQARRARIVPMERMGEIEALRLVSEEPGPERRATARQELEQLCDIIATLPAKCRRVFQLRSFEDCSRREIAERMSISERTVEKHLIKAFDRVGEALARQDAESDTRKATSRNSEHDAGR